MKLSEIKLSYHNKNPVKIQVMNSKELYLLALSIWSKDTLELQEEVKVLYLNKANLILGYYELAKGGISGCWVDIRIILSTALKANASELIVIHNHPSGNINPSNQDLELTKRIQEACKLLELVLLDHMIITKDSYFSFADKGDL